jgi:anti-anti-sigma regulatory factor
MTAYTLDGQQVERERRLRILEWLLYICGGIVLAVGMLLIVLAGDITASISATLIKLAGLLLGIIVAWGLTRARQLEPAAHLLFVALAAATFATGLNSGIDSDALYTLFIPIVGATLLLSPFWSCGYAGLALLVYMSLYVLGPNPADKSALGLFFNMVLFSGYFGIVALLSFLAARGYEQQLSLSRRQTEELEQARAELEERVTARTQDIQQAMEDLRLNAETIQQLSAPILPVADSVLALPLVGALDSKRAAFMTEQLLAAISRERVRVVLIDITGVPLVDTQVAGALLRTAQAVRLLGAEPVLVGMRAEVAQMLVGLGADLGDLVSQRDLRGGLAYAFQYMETRDTRALRS